MKAILFDCRDKGLGCTLRLISDEGHTLLQGQIYSGGHAGYGPVEMASRIAAGFGLVLDYRGPPETIRGHSETPAAESPAVKPRKTVAKGKVVLTPRYLFE